MTTVTALASKQKVEREARLKWVPIPQMTVSPVSQRELNEARVDKLVANFDLEQIGTPTVNLRDGQYYIIDGQHRVETLRRIGWEDQQVQCWTYVGLSEEEEAEKFLKLNDYLAVNAFARFRVAVQAGRPIETDIDRIVRANGMCVSISDTEGSISAVGTLKRVYARGGPVVLSQTLNLVGNSFGTVGLTAAVIDGIGYVIQRYGSDLDREAATEKFSKMMGGASGLLGKAAVVKKTTGKPQGLCVAAAAVDVLNSGKGGKKLQSWWVEA